MLDKLSMLDILSIIMDDKNKLGKFLKEARKAEKATLRFVEQQTGISNAYLSQLENGKIRQPSPTLLHKLCELYDVSYAEAMKLAGYPLPNESDVSSEPIHTAGPGLFGRFGDITADEEKKLAEYLDFLRSKPRRMQ